MSTVPAPEGSAADKAPRAPSVAEAWHQNLVASGTGYRVALNRRIFERSFLRFSATRTLLRYIPTGAHTLEVGCASALATLALAVQGRRGVALDYSPHALRSACGHHAIVEGWQGPVPVRFVRGDAEGLPFATGSFDAVFNNGVVEHWLDADARRGVIREMARVTRPHGGRVVVLVPNGRHPLYDHWRRTGYPGWFAPDVPPWVRYDVDMLAGELAACGLRVVARGGLEAYASLAVWPRRRWWQRCCRLLERALPRTPRFAERWGVEIYAVGERP